MVPKCTSWLGHKFEGRYSEYMPKDRTLEFQKGSIDLVRSFKTITYECDICVRCGHVIDHKVNEKVP